MASRRALVTGLSGFTGRYLGRALAAAGFRVFGLAPHASGSPEHFAVDLEDRAGLSRVVEEVQPDVVVHLAAISFVGHADAADFYRVNLIGTRNLLDAVAAGGHAPACVLLASSANVYGNVAGGPLTETSAVRPANDYAVSKLAMEYMAALWTGRLPIVTVRPFNYTGVGQSGRFLLPKIVDHFRRGSRVIELGNLDVARDFSDVRSVVDAYLRLIRHAPAGQTFNVCSGQAVSLEQILEMMAEIAGYRIEVHVNPDFVRANEVKRLHGSRARLEAAVGELPWTPLRETLRWMYEAPESA
ncbi:NAD-dependent epimerase/dehydratase family protein [Thioalkalivibrio paradoxus]|uniref:GDP-6-deoxy-D-lyxo-4-hexulose reductase n=1 Tax=Thioalkalivibrio paradoxus ARh 1 TaxID=713585 RepID=W0DJ90_9GAMM|nr:GDP-mannose 4,6-dehydratase [Thioalkalivibrio paradoxus]AHE98516.1 GDP-6-deoxy-D-lyxo-4-hexulose reductase [Thioalkalivibrio paradoxus ARh 1]